jgi:uncharacterized protein (DUF58 family)
MTAIRVLALAIGLIVYGLIDDWRALTLIGVSLVVLTVVAWLWSRASLRGVGFARRLSSDRVQVGDTLSEELAIQNRSLLGKLFVELTDKSTLPGHSASRVIHLPPRSARQWQAASIAMQRGRHRLGPVTLRSGDPFGLFRREIHIEETIDVTIYPLAVELPDYLPAVALQSGGATLQRRSTQPTATVGGIRDYVQGDATNRISWTATARTGHLMVKEFETDPTADVWVVLDLNQPAWQAPVASRHPQGDDPIGWITSEFEYRIVVACSLVRRCLSLGRSVGIVISAETPIIHAPEQSDRQFARILELLAEAEPNEGAGNTELLTSLAPRFRRDQALLIVTSTVDEGMVPILAAMRQRRISPEVMLVRDTGPADTAVSSLSERLYRERIPNYQMRPGQHPSVILRDLHRRLEHHRVGHAS